MGFDDQASKQVSPLQKAQRSSWEYMQRLYVRCLSAVLGTVQMHRFQPRETHIETIEARS